MYDIGNITSVHVEATSMCNARCPMCSRYTLDGYLQSGIEETHLDPAAFYKLIDSLPLIRLVYFSGVYGDPCIHPELLAMCKYARTKGIDVQVDTNVGYRKPDFWRDLAHAGVYVNFAIDGLEDTNKIYRKNVEWSILEKNLKAFATAGGKGRWNFIVFQHNEHQVDDAKKMAESLGIDFRVKITQKFRRAKVWDVMINGSKAYEIKPPINSQYRHPNISNKSYSISYPPVSKSIDVVDISCKALANKEVFLNYQGLVLPCCYIGTVHGQSPASKQLETMNLSNYSIIDFSIEEILASMKTISESWEKTLEDGRIIMCAQTCGKSKPQHTQYGESNG